MTPEELAAVFAEELPTGTFGGPRPRPHTETRPVDPRAAEHVADLRAELDARNITRDPRRVHLRVVGDDERAAS